MRYLSKYKGFKDNWDTHIYFFTCKKKTKKPNYFMTKQVVNYKMMPILANLCCLEANLVSNFGKKELSKCSYNLLGHKKISFYFIGKKYTCPIF